MYGNAILENATKTAEGIQKLGDMMRFMLHDNELEAIPLTKSVDYLLNYIDLQKLRIDSAPNITLEVEVQPPPEHQLLIPMVLIPFAENAFKYGISMHHPSWIHLQLKFIGSQMEYSVVNSIPPKREPNHQKSTGMGLQNLKSRLAYFYPGQHQLELTHTEDTFRAELTIQLIQKTV